MNDKTGVGLRRSFLIFLSSLLLGLSCAQNTSLPNTCTQEELDECPPNSPLIPCCLLPEEFYVCDNPVILVSGNTNASGCPSFSTGRFEDVPTTSVSCAALDGVDCCGFNDSKVFLKRRVPCLQYQAMFFPTMVLFSVFLGFCGIDRLCMGYCCLGIAKMLTLGGLGVWWLVDVILLLTGNLQPNNNVSWDRFY